MSLKTSLALVPLGEEPMLLQHTRGIRLFCIATIADTKVDAVISEMRLNWSVAEQMHIFTALINV